MPLGVSDALASATCGDLCVSLRVIDAGRQRRDGGTSLALLLLSAVLQEPVRTTRTGQRCCREVLSMVTDSRTSSR